MTSTKFLEKVYRTLDDHNYIITFSPAKKKNYMMYCNGNFIGGLFDDELCLIYSQAGNTFLNDVKPVYCGYTDGAQHKMLIVPFESAKEVLRLTYKEIFSGSVLLYDITHTGMGVSDIEQFYDSNVEFLRFCYDNELLNQSPLDKKERIIRMVFYKRDLTTKGEMIFRQLLSKFLIFYDRGGKTDLCKMLKKWFGEFEKRTENSVNQNCKTTGGH